MITCAWPGAGGGALTVMAGCSAAARAVLVAGPRVVFFAAAAGADGGASTATAIVLALDEVAAAQRVVEQRGHARVGGGRAHGAARLPLGARRVGGAEREAGSRDDEIVAGVYGTDAAGTFAGWHLTTLVCVGSPASAARSERSGAARVGTGGALGVPLGPCDRGCLTGA
jgi:hypothetical protein